MYHRAIDHEGITYSIQVLSSHTKLDRRGCSWSVLLKSVIVRNTHIIVLSGYGLLRKGNGYLYHLWCASECFSSLTTVEPLNKGHIDTSHFVHCRVIVHSSEMKRVSIIAKSILVIIFVLCMQVISIMSFIHSVL